MITSIPDSDPKGPTSEMLAGVYIEIAADEDLTVVPCQPPILVTPSVEGFVPGVDQLAGRFVSIEGPEDLTARAPAKEQER